MKPYLIKPTTIMKRSMVINAHKTSISLEQEFFDALKAIAKQRGITLADLASLVDANREAGNLSSALRLFVLSHYQGAAQARAA